MKANQDNFMKAQDIIGKFKKLREKIFDLRYKAEHIDLNMLRNLSVQVFNEFELILPVIKKLTDSAEFITEEEYEDWKAKHSK